MFIAMNRFKVRKGSERDFQQVWLSRQTHLEQVPGFMIFRLLKGPEKDRVYVREEEVRPATEDIFRAMGLSDENAVLSADVLMTNDLRGVETHGVSNMLRSYVQRYRDGKMNPTPEIKVERETDTTAVLDGDGGIGLHVGPYAMKMAIEKAAEFGLGAVCVHNVGHMGGAGYHAMLALSGDGIGWSRALVRCAATGASSALFAVPLFTLAHYGLAKVGVRRLPGGFWNV